MRGLTITFFLIAGLTVGGCAKEMGVAYVPEPGLGAGEAPAGGDVDRDRPDHAAQAEAEAEAQARAEAEAKAKAEAQARAQQEAQAQAKARERIVQNHAKDTDRRIRQYKETCAALGIAPDPKVIKALVSGHESCRGDIRKCY